MTAPLEAVVTRVLAEHFYGAGSQGRYCQCGAMGVGDRQANYRAHVAAELAAAIRADEGLVEAMSEALFAREYGAYSPDAHPDHNRWTWRGDGHHEDHKDEFRHLARAALDAITGGES